jgi:hypothetical protein
MLFLVGPRLTISLDGRLPLIGEQAIKAEKEQFMNRWHVHVQGQAPHPLVLGGQEINRRADRGGLDPAGYAIRS